MDQMWMFHHEGGNGQKRVETLEGNLIGLRREPGKPVRQAIWRFPGVGFPKGRRRHPVLEDPRWFLWG